jgi:hypothetical protein
VPGFSLAGAATSQSLRLGPFSQFHSRDKRIEYRKERTKADDEKVHVFLLPPFQRFALKQIIGDQRLWRHDPAHMMPGTFVCCNQSAAHALNPSFIVESSVNDLLGILARDKEG